MDAHDSRAALDREQGGGDGCVIVCGHFGFDKEVLHPLVASLPPVIELREHDRRHLAWLDGLVGHVAEESAADQPGASAIVERLMEILFVHVLRDLIERRGDDLRFFAGLHDPHVGRALRAMHADVRAPWTVERLARESAMSRTSFAERFRELTGLAPMHYLALLRVQKARGLLAEGALSTSQVAERVGYASEAAFARAFRRLTGSGPGAFRRKGRRAA